MFILVREIATSYYNVHLKLNKISKIIIDFLHQNFATVWDFDLYFRYDIRECQFHKRSALTISKFLLYDDTLALLVTCHIVLSLFNNLEIHISNLYSVMYDTCPLLG